MSKYRKSFACRFSYTVILLAVIFGVCLFVFHRQASKHLSEICEYMGKQTASEIIASSVDNALQSHDEEFITITRNESGDITSVETDSAAISRLENELRKSINTDLAKIEDENLAVSIGTLSGISIFSGRGHCLKIKLTQVGAVDCRLKSEFVGAGINQTKHRITVDVTVEMIALLPLHSTEIEVEGEYLVSETIIAGRIPSVYLNSE